MSSYLVPGNASGPVTTTNVYNANNDLVETDRPEGGLTLYGYDGAHSVITTTELVSTSPVNCAQFAPQRGAQPPALAPGGPEVLGCHYVFQWRANVQHYDAYGERIAAIDGRGVPVDNTASFTSADPHDSLPTVVFSPTLAAPYTRVYGYDPQGDQTSASTPPITTTLPGGQVQANAPVATTYGYDGDGNQTGETSANGNTTSYGYDHLGRQVSVTLPQVRLYDGRTVAPVETTRYDGDGNILQQVDGNGDVTTSSYDPWQRQVATTDPVSGTSVYTYSATEQTQQRDPVGHVTTEQYDPAGRLIQQTDPATGTVQYAYDPAGNTIAITTGSPAGAVQTQQMQYDAQDELIRASVGMPGGSTQTTQTAYDRDGNAVQTEQPDGDTVYDSYDLVDQQIAEETDPAPVLHATGPSYSRTSYDAAGNAVQNADADNRTSTTTYDGDNRQLQNVAATSAPTGTTTLTTTLGYDPDSNVLTRTTQTSDTTNPGIVQTHTYTATYNAADWQASGADDGMVTQYAQDAAGRQRSETLLGGQGALTTALDPRGRATAIGESIGGSGPYTSTFGYTADDRPYTISVPGGVGETAGYDVNDRLAHLGASGPNTGAVTTTLASGYDYAYNPNGWMTAVTSTLNNVVTSTQYMHNALGRLVQWSGQPNGPESWGYDGNGNLITNTEFLDGQYRTTVYTYSATMPNQQIQQHTDGYGVEYYRYDQHGDTTSITSTDPITSLYHVDIHLSYDAAERPITVTTLQNMVPITVSLAYNAAGERSRYTVSMSGTATLDEHFQYRDGDLGQVSAMTATLNGQGQVTSSGAYTDTYVYGGLDQPLEFVRQQNGQTSRYFYALDGQGNVVAVTDVNGHVVDRYAYDPWGEGLPAGTDETLPQPLRYRGYWWDGEMGWYWLSTRSYDPEGRFLQPDPTQLDGVLTYVYADDDPVDLMEAGGAFGLGDVFHAAVAFVETSAHVVYKISETAWDLVAGDDIHTICCTDQPLYVKMLAGVDLALTILPGADVTTLLRVGARVAVKAGAERGAIKLVRWVIGHTVGRVDVDDETIARAIRDRAEHGPGELRAAEEGVGCALCFPAGTRVATAHGARAIQTLRVGDIVLAEDPKTGKVEAETVQAAIVDPVSPLLAVELSDGSAITVTADHPFWVDTGEGLTAPGWIAAGDLRPGDVLRTASGTGVVVEGLRYHVGHAAVYTLTVTKDHTFFVGQARVLVHNSNCDRSLIDVLKREGVKFTEHDIVGLLRTPAGRVVFLEKGTLEAGLAHILKGHAADFAAKGVSSQDEIVNLILDTLRTETPVRTVGRSGLIYNVTVKGHTFPLAIVIVSNGFIVSAYPAG